MEKTGETKKRFLDDVVGHHERTPKNNVEAPQVCDLDGSMDDRGPLEDTNRNQFFFSSSEQRKLLSDQIHLLKHQQTCAKKLSELTINGPVKLLNGESENAGDRVSSGKLLDISSHQRKVLKDGTSRDSIEGQASGVVTEDTELNDSGPCHVCQSDIEGSNDAEASNATDEEPVLYVSYQSELQMPEIMSLIQKDLSEPYSIYTYRYFIHNWPQLCFLAMVGKCCVGAIVCKLDMHRKVVKRGYIAMLAVDEKYRKRKIGSNLVLKAIRAMVADGADEVVLETEITNKPALRLYENLGFVRDKRLFRYYLNGVDALRLKLWLR